MWLVINFIKVCIFGERCWRCGNMAYIEIFKVLYWFNRYVNWFFCRLLFIMKVGIFVIFVFVSIVFCIVILLFI